MNRSYSLLLALPLSVGALCAAGCNPVVCGPGTKQMQKSSGELECVPADQPANQVICDRDAGAEFKAGICVSRTVCGPNTEARELPSGEIVCVGTGTGNGCECSTPTNPAAQICIHGKIFDWSTNMQVAGGKQRRVRAFDPLAFLGGSRTPLGGVEDIGDENCYVLKDVPINGTLLAVALDNPDGAGSDLQLAGSGASNIIKGQTYEVDLFMVPKSVVEGWSSQAGVDYNAMGVYAGIYVDSPVPPSTEAKNEPMVPTVSGVTLRIGANPAPNAKYLGPDRNTVSAGATTTTSVGVAITTPPPTIDTFSGSGGTCTLAAGGMGPCMWAANPGSSAPGVLFISRFHRTN
jgi:hypothetical protein